MDKRAIYDDIISQFENIEHKGKTMPYTSLNGHMFSFISKEDEVGIRLSKSDREAFLEAHPDAIMEQHGRLMKEYIKLPESYFSDPEKTKSLISQSFDYVSGLKPKK